MGLFRLGWTQGLLREALGGFDGTQILSHVEATVIWCKMVPITDRPKSKDTEGFVQSELYTKCWVSTTVLSTYSFLEDPFASDGCMDTPVVF